MENVKTPATERSPELEFDFAANKFAIRGESYPENVNDFYGDVIGNLEEHFGAQDNAEIQFDFELIYFNSSSAKILMTLFDLLDAAADAGNKVTINWHFAEDDDNMEELGEEFAEDLENAGRAG